MENKSQISKYFTQADKIKLYKRLEQNMSLGFVLALDMFDEALGRMVEKKQAEFKDILDAMDKQIQARELKDGKTPEAGKDYPSPAEFKTYIAKLIAEIPLPTLSKEDIESMVAMVLRKVPKQKDGVSPKPGKDYPTYKELGDFITSRITGVRTDTKIITEVKTDSADLMALKKEIIDLRQMVSNIKRSTRGKSRGGGDSVVAGSNVTITRLTGGRRSVAASASAGSLSVETPVGTIDDANKSFTVSNTPTFIILNGVIQTASGVDYTLSGTTITFINAPSTGSILRSYYA